MFCNNCGAQIPEGSDFCQTCGKSVDLSPVSPDSAPPPSTTTGWQLPRWGSTEANRVLAVAGGASMMLIALAVPWYTAWLRGPGWSNSANMWFRDLMDTSTGEHLRPNWLGWGLPIVLIIVFASLCLLSVIYGLMRRSQPRRFWLLLGILSLLSALANFGYVSWFMTHFTRDLCYGGNCSCYTTPHAGFVLALLGAVALILGSAIGRES
jgi:hypothetical protein